MHGLHCIVTGATQGIGRAITLALAARGAKLSLSARTATRVAALVDELAGADLEAFGAPCDVTDEQQVGTFLGAARARFGAVHVLVNNAGLAHFAPVDETSTEAFDETMAVNVRGAS